MDHLPRELVDMITAELVHEDAEKEPPAWLERRRLSELGEVSDWTGYSKATRSDFCNFRLVNRKFYHSSFATFGNILGHRVFRITQVGLEDLQAISNVPRLRPHICTLTFGTARFADPASLRSLQCLLDGIPEPARTRLLAAYSVAYQWQQAYGGSRYTKEVAGLLERLPQLRSLRIFLSDLPTPDNHLGGWLGSGDAELLKKAQGRFDMLGHLQHVHAGIYHDLDKDLTALKPFFNALKASRTVIRDLRTGHWKGILPHDFSRMLQNTGMMSSLTHLRFVIRPDHLQEIDSFTCQSFHEVFEQITNVTHLKLGMEYVSAFERHAEATHNLLGLLKLLNRPQHLTVRGVWEYSENHLVDLIATHKESLEFLSLKEPVLSTGDWTSTVQHLMQFQLRHLQVSDMREWSSNRGESSPVGDGTWQKFVSSVKKDVEDQKTCEVHLSSGGAEYFFQPGAK
jgi:hypothetical protein